MRWVLGVLALLLLGGCFGGVELSPEAEYTRKANAVCRKDAAQRKALGVRPKSGTAAAAKYLTTAGEIGLATRTELFSLAPPPSLRQSVKELKRFMRVAGREAEAAGRAARLLQADIRAGHTGHRADLHSKAVFRAERRSLTALKRVDQLLQQIGLRDCEAG